VAIDPNMSSVVALGAALRTAATQQKSYGMWEVNALLIVSINHLGEI
jgi:hypothetical protein